MPVINQINKLIGTNNACKHTNPTLLRDIGPGIRYMPIMIGTPDTNTSIDPDIDPNIGYFSDTSSRYRVLMSQYRVTPDIWTSDRDHVSRYRETPDHDIGT